MRDSKIYKKIRTRGPENGYCAICRRFGPLTREHIPPKSCGNMSAVKLRALLGASKAKSNSSIVQGGLNYRSTCSGCNNFWLGKKYGPSLTEFASTVTKYANSLVDHNLTLPLERDFVAEPQKIARAVMGCIMAGNAIDLVENPRPHAHIYKLMHDYFFDSNASLPEEFEIYYWFYPSKEVKILKAMTTCFEITKCCVSYELIKFFPLAFMIVWRKEDVKLHHPKLIKDRNMSIDTKDYLTVNFKQCPDTSYPEMPTKRGTVLFNNEQATVGENFSKPKV